jgi:predicted ATP-grasp superfamily ATP-dependent carboligase
MREDKTKVLITSAEFPTGLSTARALAGPDVEITGLCSNLDNNCCKSHYWHQLVPVEISRDAYLEKLIEVGAQSKGKMVLFITHDYLVKLVSDNRDDLEQYYDFVLPDRATVDLLLDKTLFHPWAQEHGFAVPQSYVATSAGELDDILGAIQFPIVLKPCYRDEKWGKKSKGHKIYRLDKRADIDNIPFELFHAAQTYIVQQWIPGPDSNVHFSLEYYDRTGREVDYFTGRKLVQWFRETGNTAVGVSTEYQDVHDITCRLFDILQFRGLGSVELKLDNRDNTFYITEPTVGRNNLQSYLAVAGGINLSRMALFDAIGKNHRKNGTRKTSLWIHEVSILKIARDEIVREGFHFFSILQICVSLIRKCRNRAFCYFSKRDPLPFIYLFVELIKGHDIE